MPIWFRPFCADAIATEGAQAALTSVLGAVPVAAIVLQAVLAPALNLGGLVTIAVLIEAWFVRCSLLIPLLGVSIASQLAMVPLGGGGLLEAASRAAALSAVAGMSRMGALGWLHWRRAHQRDLEALLDASNALAESSDLEDVGAGAVRAACGTVARPEVRGGRPAVLLRVWSGGAALVAACDAEGRALLHAPGVARCDPDALRAVVATGCPGAVPLAPVEAGETAAASDDGVGALAMARVMVGGEPFGVLAVGAPDLSGFQREDLRVLDGIARVTGLALATALRHAELGELKERLEQSVDLALETGRSLEPDRVAASTLVRVVESVNADRGTLARMDGQGLTVESTYWADGRRLVTVARHFSTESVEAVPSLAAALATCQPVIAGPIEAGPFGRELATTLADGRHTLVFPFVVAGRLARVLVVARDTGPAFDEHDLHRLEPMADVALLALRNAHLYAEAEEAQREASTSSGRLRLAIDAAEDIGSSAEVSEVLERVLRRAVEVAHADRGSVSRLEGGRLVVEIDHDRTGPAMGKGTSWDPAGVPLVADAMRRGRPVTGRRPVDPASQFGRWCDTAAVQHLLSCPLMVGREIVGMLGLSRRRDQPFTEGELATLMPFATLAGLLLRNAWLLAEARQVGQAKSAFLNLAAHELRTPLAVIRGYLSMLEDGTYAVPEKTRDEAVRTLVAKAHELEALVEGLLTTARLDAARLPRALSEFDVREAIRQALVRIGPRALLEGGRIGSELPDGDAMTRADWGQVARILDNLLNNALTYSRPPAQVTVGLRPGDALEVAIADRGVGVPADQHEAIFERFHRAEGASSRFTPGLGLGLAISRDLARLNGGDVVLERSAPGNGSVFVLRLPRLAAATA